MIKTIIYIIIGILILSYFGIDIKRAVESPKTRENFSYVTQAVLYVWDHFLEKPVTFIWKEIIIKLIWNNILEGLKGKSTVLNEMPKVGP